MNSLDGLTTQGIAHTLNDHTAPSNVCSLLYSSDDLLVPGGEIREPRSHPAISSFRRTTSLVFLSVKEEAPHPQHTQRHLVFLCVKDLCLDLDQQAQRRLTLESRMVLNLFSVI